MINKHCYNCLYPKACKNYKKDLCLIKSKSDLFTTITGQTFCPTDCFECKHEDTCVSSCKEQECSQCKYYKNICTGQAEVIKKYSKSNRENKK